MLDSLQESWKLEIRIRPVLRPGRTWTASKSETNPNDKNPRLLPSLAGTLNVCTYCIKRLRFENSYFEHSILFRVSDFVLRILPKKSEFSILHCAVVLIGGRKLTARLVCLPPNLPDTRRVAAYPPG